MQEAVRVLEALVPAAVTPARGPSGAVAHIGVPQFVAARIAAQRFAVVRFIAAARFMADTVPAGAESPRAQPSAQLRRVRTTTIIIPTRSADITRIHPAIDRHTNVGTRFEDMRCVTAC